MLARTGFKNRGSGLVRKSPMKKHGAPKGKRRAELKRGSTAAKEYMARVAGLGCAVCRLIGLGATPAQVHHKKQGTGMGERAPDEETVPLCEEHHNGVTGIHRLKSHGFFERYGVTEQDLIDQTQAELGYKGRG